MTNSLKKSDDADLLRQKAEQLYKNKQSAKTEDHTPGAESSRSEADTIRLLYELEVHQIELEMQNDELQLAKEKAETNAEKYSNLYDFAPFGYFTLDWNCSICELNFNAANMLGKDRSQLINSNFKLFITPDNRIDFTSFLDKVFKTKKIQNCELRFTINKNPGIFIHIGGIFSVTEQKYFLTVVDITARKQTEKVLIENLRLGAIGEMASSIAHDFNNSLQAMMGNLELVISENDFSDSTLERLNNIGSIITDVAGRVTALQHFGDTDHEDKKTELIDLNTLIIESLKQSRPLWKDGMEKEGLKLSVITDFKDIPEINCNRGELKLALYNLIKNSVEAMPEGGDITIKTGIKAKGVYVTFTDSGKGMDEETKLKIFQPFYSTKGFELGRGLGMSGVYSTVKKHDGDIVVKSSKLGKGTTIEMAFPVGQQDEIKNISINNEPEDKASLTILWVDDDIDIRKSSSKLLKLMGHKCVTANSGKNALQYLSKNHCDIVFTDIGMPEMTGWELADAIRNELGNKIKIVVVSGWDIEEKVKNKHDVNLTLQKPFAMEQLKKLLIAL